MMINKFWLKKLFLLDVSSLLSTRSPFFWVPHWDWKTVWCSVEKRKLLAFLQAKNPIHADVNQLEIFDQWQQLTHIFWDFFHPKQWHLIDWIHFSEKKKSDTVELAHVNCDIESFFYHSSRNFRNAPSLRRNFLP